MSTPADIPPDERLDPPGLARLQRAKLGPMIEQLRRSNAFYRTKLAEVSFDPAADPIDALLFTTRDDIQRDQADHPPFGTNLTFPIERYTRFHQTSGSTGAPVRWLDTPESWEWWKRCWAAVYRGAGVTPADRVVFTFSFGPFIGFWSAFESAADLGCLCLAAGGMTTHARLHYIRDNAATVICCTPTYALHVAEIAGREGFDLGATAVRAIIVAGEPGGSIPATRARIESGWGGRVFDHAGLTEVGAWGFESVDAPGGLHVNEPEFIVEVVDPATGRLVADGSQGELVLTNLGRVGSPLIRYRTGDLVRLRRGETIGGRALAWAEGGVLGRVDDMLIIRGNNVFPAAVENVVREFTGIAEFRLRPTQRDSMTELIVEIEPGPGADAPGLCAAVEKAVRDRLHFRPIVQAATPGSLPRYEMKARRIVREGTAKE